MNISAVSLLFLWLNSLSIEKREEYLPYCLDLTQGIIHEEPVEIFVDINHVEAMNKIKMIWPDQPEYQQIYLNFLNYVRDFIEYEQEEYELLLEILSQGEPL